MTIDAGHIALLAIAVWCGGGWLYEVAYHNGRDDQWEDEHPSSDAADRSEK